MTLLTFDAVTLEFGDKPILTEADLSIDENERSMTSPSSNPSETSTA